MQKPKILSTPPPMASHGATHRPEPPIFDACHAGVVLRALLFVQAWLCVGLLFVTGDALQWFSTLALVTAGALPATLCWLLAICSLRHGVQGRSSAVQYLLGVALGAMAGALACAALQLALLVEHPPWAAASGAGALLAGQIVAGLVLRARAQAPATTFARLSELQARIRPHFLFNTLNSAIALVRSNPDQAETLLEDLSDLFRHALQEPGSTTTLAEEIALAQRYLAIEQVRFGQRLRVQWQLDGAADGARLPPLLLQPLVENAVKHGVERSHTGSKLRISTQRRGARAIIRITNTLPPEDAPQTPGHGIALSNVRDRLALLHDVQADLRIQQRGGLYQVRITLPCQ